MASMMYGLTAVRRRMESVDRKDRGAALVEFALVSIVLIVIVLGLIEGGLMVRANNAVRNAADDAARRGSIAGTDPTADYQILQQLKARGVTLFSRVNRIVIYNAPVASAQPSALCRAGTPVADECNVYSQSDMDLPESSFGCSGGLDSSWCPTDRGTDGGFGYIGVYVDATHEAVVGAVDVDLKARSTLALETSGED